MKKKIQKFSKHNQSINRKSKNLAIKKKTIERRRERKETEIGNRIEKKVTEKSEDLTGTYK